MLHALVHTVSPRIAECELTFLPRKMIDYQTAVKQHDDYCALLEKHGVNVTKLSVNGSAPDACFIEDTAVMFDDFAIISNMGTESRRDEPPRVEKEIVKHRKVARILPPATLEGGDVIVIGNSVFVGRSGRSNEAGIAALRRVLQSLEYEIIPVEIRDCLHLKSACTAVSNRSLLVNPDWVDITPFGELNIITVDESEPEAANAIRIHDTVCLHSGFPKTAQLLRDLDFKVDTVDVSEFLKCEAGLSCLSLRFTS